VAGLEHEAVQQTLLGDASEHAEVGIVVWNDERRYVAINRKACSILGTTREAMLASHVGETNRSAETAGVIERLLHNVPARGAMTVERADGTSVDVEWIVFPTTAAGLPHYVGYLWEASAL